MLVFTIPFERPIALSLSQGRWRKRSQQGQAVGERMMAPPKGGLSHAAGTSFVSAAAPLPLIRP